SVEAGGIARRTIRSHGAAGAWEWQSGPATPRLGAEWRLRPGRGGEPALRLEVDAREPRVVAASWKNSLIRDPVGLVAILSVEAGGIARRTIRSHGAAGAWEWQSGPATPRLGAEWRLRPGRGGEPALRLEVDAREPRVVAASWKNSLIRDPVVLVAILSME